MANPFYIPPRSSTANFALQTLGTLGQLRQGRERNEIAQRANELDQMKLAQEKEQFGIQSEQVNEDQAIRRRANVLKEADMPAHKRPLKPLDVTKMKKVAMDLGIEKYVKEDIKDFMKSAQEGVAREVPIKNLMGKINAKKKEWYEEMEKDWMKAVDEGDNTRAYDLAETMRLISDDKDGELILGQVFGASLQSMAMEDAAAQAALMKAMPDQFGEPYTDSQGNLLQMNKVTGQVSKIASPPKGWVIESDGQGGFRMVQGVGATGLQRKTTGAIEGNIMNATEGIARLNEIAATYQPEFLELGTKWNALKTRWGEKLKGVPFTEWTRHGVSQEDKQQLREFANFKRTSLDNISRYIKEITGAQMSEREADRIRKGMPDPGEGLFDGDAPSEFESNWASTMRSLRAVQARNIYYLKSGFEPGEIQRVAKSGTMMSIADIQNRINERGQELESQGLSPEEVKMQLNQEFFSFGQ